MSSIAAPAGRNATTRQMIAWAMFDWASSPFFAVVITFVFATYVTTVVAPNEIEGTALWSRMTVVAALLIALISPVLGAIADAAGGASRGYCSLSSRAVLRRRPCGSWHPSTTICCWH